MEFSCNHGRSAKGRNLLTTTPVRPGMEGAFGDPSRFGAPADWVSVLPGAQHIFRGCKIRLHHTETNRSSKGIELGSASHTIRVSQYNGQHEHRVVFQCDVLGSGRDAGRCADLSWDRAEGVKLLVCCCRARPWERGFVTDTTLPNSSYSPADPVNTHRASLASPSRIVRRSDAFADRPGFRPRGGRRDGICKRRRPFAHSLPGRRSSALS